MNEKIKDENVNSSHRCDKFETQFGQKVVFSTHRNTQISASNKVMSHLIGCTLRFRIFRPRCRLLAHLKMRLQRGQFSLVRRSYLVHYTIQGRISLHWFCACHLVALLKIVFATRSLFWCDKWWLDGSPSANRIINLWSEQEYWDKTYV